MHSCTVYCTINFISNLTHARHVLDELFPELADQIELVTPNEQDKRHGQAVAAASLPMIPKA